MTRRLIGVITAVLVLGLTATAAPTIHVDLETYDFGSIVEGYAIEHTFVLTNVGDETLIIDNVKALCGCTTTALATNELEPGESVDVHVVVTTGGAGGQPNFSRAVYVYSNDPRYAPGQSPSKLILRVEGSVLRNEPYRISTEDFLYYSILLVDLRTEADYASGHFLGAVNISSAQLRSILGLLPHGNVVILYDATGADAYPAAVALRDDGFPSVIALDGGLSDWSRVNGALYILPEPASLEYGEPFFAPEADSGPRPPVVGRDSFKSSFYVLVDLRAPEAYAEGHLTGAVNITLDESDDVDLSPWLGDLPSDTEIIVYDQTGAQSDIVVQTLIASGYRNAKSLQGGLDEWQRLYYDELIWADTP